MNYCDECKYVVQGLFIKPHPNYWRCWKPTPENRISPLTGSVALSSMPLCKTKRESENDPCGMEGNEWEAAV